MLTLYYRPTCPFCQRVLGEAEEMGVQFNLKNISSDEALVEELVSKGGKKQVPFLVDEEKGVSMYESADIIDYLKDNNDGVGDKSFSGLRVHKSEDTCDACE